MAITDGTRAPRLGAAIMLAVVLLAVGACTSGGASTKPSPTDSQPPATVSLPHVIAPLVQCFADQHLIPATYLKGSSSWLRNGKVASNPQFEEWWGNNGGLLTVKGKTLINWATEVATDIKNWPAGICGSAPSASAAP
jgi:hypothetical protein